MLSKTIVQEFKARFSRDAKTRILSGYIRENSYSFQRVNDSAFAGHYVSLCMGDLEKAGREMNLWRSMEIHNISKIFTSDCVMFRGWQDS